MTDQNKRQISCKIFSFRRYRISENMWWTRYRWIKKKSMLKPWNIWIVCRTFFSHLLDSQQKVIKWKKQSISDPTLVLKFTNQSKIQMLGKSQKIKNENHHQLSLLHSCHETNLKISWKRNKCLFLIYPKVNKNLKTKTMKKDMAEKWFMIAYF